MKLIPDSNDSLYQIRSYTPGAIKVNENTYERSLIVSASELITNWRPQAFLDLQTADWEPVLALEPELILFGTGQFFKPAPHPLLEPVYRKKIGIETMSTAAACRTFMALTAEGRKVTAALLIQ
ncbi:MAG: Mth938-like domain-containing protein [Proteobacteria bacterium]|nr:Mth938-like domain-containing protein [Pseudomonadota bacterium]